jgi:putative tricarboxylic transport membrane protein
MIAPPLAAFALRFGPPEYTALLVLGLIFLAHMSSTSLPRTLLMASRWACCSAPSASTISPGISLFVRHRRARRRHRHRAAAVGLFGLGEIPSTPSATVVGQVMAPKLRELLPNRQEWRESVWPIVRQRARLP